MSFYLSNKDYKEMIGIISGDTGSKKGNGESITYLDTELTAQEPKKQQQGIVADTVDAVQMGAWKGVSDIAHGVGALTGADWLHDVGDWAAKGADENVASMSDEMKAALNQNAFDGEGQGVRNLRWWAGNLGSLIGQNLDTALTLGAGKIATIGAKQAGKLLLKKEVAEEVGKTAVEQAAKRGIPQKYWNMVGITATMSAMSGGGRYGQKRDEVMGMTNEQLAQIPQFSDEYYSIADSDEGKGKSTDELYTMAKKSFADKVGRDAALNPTAIATDLVTNAVSGLGGGFWGLGSPAKTIKGGLLKGAAVEGGTEAIQGIGEQYALNKADQDYLNPNKDLTEGMADNAINGAVIGAVFGSAMGGLDTHTDRIAFNNQKRTILNHINTGNDAVDSQLRNYVDMLNHGATELGDLVSASRVQALNNAGIATAKARQVAEEALAEQQAKAKFESDFFDEEQPQQETTSTFKVDPNLERALELHSILGQFRKNDLSRANEFIDTPTIFADEQAQKDYVIGRAFDEVRNIAQSYGIDPKDGKAMRRWLEDYAEKAKEYTSDDQQYNSSSNQQDSENLNGQPYNISKQTSEEVSSLKEPNQPIDFNLGAATKDLSIQPEVNLGYNSALARQNSNLVGFDLNQPLSNQQSAEYDGINPVGNGLLSTHMNQSQLGRQLTADSSLGDLNSIAKDINADNQIQKDSNSDFRLSLNESADSDFAKAVDTTIQGGKPSRQYIPMGTTPDALKMLGLPDTKVLVSRDVLRKVMLDKHNVTAETLKQLPKQINHPIAIMKSAPQATHDGYVVLTELLEKNISTGSDEPIISALHLKNTKDGLEVINIASVYGKNLDGLQNMLNHDLAYWNKTKGSQFIESFGLQLPSKIDSKMMSQSLDNIKTEADLSQYQASKNDQVSKFNPEVQRAQEILNQTFGKAAEHIEVATFANPPKDVRHLITSDVEGWFNPKTGKVTLIADSINATKTMSKEERLQFVAWHEMAHRGINVGYKSSYDSLMQEVGKNKAISQIADAIQAQRKNTDDLAAINRAVAIEEAIAEMMAAHETGKWNELESRYGVEIKKGQRQSTKSWLAMTAQRIKDFLSKFFGVERAAQFSDEDVLNLIARIKSSSLNETSDIGDVRFSRNEELTEERYNQAKAKGETELTFKQWQQVRSPEFKAWFGDWENDPENASKVVNERTGEPLVAYHGTGAEFNVFNKNKAGAGNDKGLRGKGFYFSPNRTTSESYGEKIIGAYVSLKNPFRPSDFTSVEEVAKHLTNKLSEQGYEDYTVDPFIFNAGNSFSVRSQYAGALSSILKDAGYDGVLYPNRQEIVAFDSNQIKSATDNTGAFSKENDDIRFSRANTAQSALDLAMTGVADSEPSAWDSLKSKDFSGFKERFNRAMGKVDEWLADSLRPVNDWIDSMHLEDQTGNTSSRDHEKRRLKDAMYVAKGKRDAINSELEQAYLKPILSKIAALSKQSQNKSHPMDELTMKRMVGNWISARYSIEKNIDLLNRDEKVMRDTKRLLDNAKQNGTSAEVRRLHEAYLKAKEQYDNRKADIYNTDYKNKGNRFKVGVAGGWSIPEAELIMSNTEKHISRSNLEYVADLVYDLNQSRLDVDRASGRYTEAEYQEYKANRHYVPLTGDPNADVDIDIISGAGSNALNIARDKTLKGRTSSEAEDAIDAVWKSIGKSTTYAGFAEFKSRIDDLFETEVALLKDKGYSDAEAREQATANLGISKRKMQGLTRSSDNVLIRKEGSDYYEYELPAQVMESLRNDNVEHANAFLKVISKPTGWYARGVTQWTVTFAPMNMMRDTWEKSEFIRVQKLYDKNNRLVDSKTMDKIGRDTIKNAFTDKEVWQATKRLGFGQELRDSVPAERMLKQLLKEGGVSNYGTYLDKTEVDLVKRLKKENNPLAGKLEKVGKVFEGYNKMFDTVSALASYKALVDNGIDSKQAAATTLELTNFRKTGSKMRGIKALYMFSQPTVMGAANLMRYLSTRKGQIRFAAYMAVMTSLYTVLRSMDDEDEGGNKMDQLGDITRYIPIPLGGGKYFKIPVGFGMAQMAWNFSTNIVKGAVGDISLTEAGTNMLVHSLKTFSPVSPSEISAAKYPMEKITLTATPSILQPVMQNVLNRSAFGNKITTNYVRDDKLKAEQSKATTAQFWKDTAIELNDTLGIDMHPEQIKNLFDGYSSMLGSLKELNTIFVENPNREDLGRKTRTPFLNQFIGTTNEFAIQSRYYEASEEAGSVYKEYKSRKERNELGDWLDADKIKLIKFHEEEESIIKKARSEKANLTRALRSGKISAIAYENGIKRYNKEMSGVQARLLRKYRQMEGLNTH